MASRFGLALILIGLIILTVFIITFQAGEGDVNTLLIGASLCASGLLLRRISARNRVRRSERFQFIRRMRGDTDEDDL
jgi:hypothetical protein